MVPRSTLFGLVIIITAACHGSTDFIMIEPVRYVPPPPEPIPDSSFGWIPTSPDDAERFVVRVGDITYQRIIEPYKVNGKITTDAAVSAFAAFAEREVVKHSYCSFAKVPEDARRLIGFNAPPEMYIAVECAKTKDGT